MIIAKNLTGYVPEIRATRRAGKRADYLLRYTRDQFLAVIEAKPEAEPAATGLQQAKDYAEIFGLLSACALPAPPTAGRSLNSISSPALSAQG